MAYNDYRFSLGLKAGKDGEVKEFFERRVLVSCPLVKKEHGTVLQAAGQQCKALALPLRKGRRGKHTILHTDFILKPQPMDILAGAIIELRRLQAKQAFEKEKVGKYGRKQLPIAITILVGYSRPLYKRLAFIGRIKTYEQLGECGLPTPVAASDKQQFARRNGQIDWAHSKFVERIHAPM